MSHGQQRELPPAFYKAMEKLQATDFVLVELTLYLDTHPWDAQAWEQFQAFSAHRQKVKADVEKYYGPLLQFGATPSAEPWKWSSSPWPWEI
ncbi:spore coat protein CotJB [Bacillaceae bacterium SIJ1]|uniref:spore coat protein CotJB n=1 Tax=Litoribacterium kuwaitense TaxID=1398745 RepID=UPI0013EC6435|nr:spore coat protein CotJB [Litoribacterium kuwaitense]NGP46608.1 spore coat protein CotJB [Litoribacterium kuwaitense]